VILAGQPLQEQAITDKQVGVLRFTGWKKGGAAEAAHFAGPGSYDIAGRAGGSASASHMKAPAASAKGERANASLERCDSLAMFAERSHRLVAGEEFRRRATG
jgi:hypothetical protein